MTRDDELKLKIYAFLKDGDANQEQTNYSGAIKSYKKALKLAKKSKDPDLVATCMRHIATSYYDQGIYLLNTNDEKNAKNQLENALKHQKESFSVVMRLCDPKREAAYFFNMGKILYNLGNYSDAYDHFHTAYHYFSILYSSIYASTQLVEQYLDYIREKIPHQKPRLLRQYKEY
ncbi:MAG: hypothetical protein HWN65_05495 [Candidatus Helarchaeota archaeon]|nr:hypothetical protein [Candidatus Helarchaeota archaeon]